MVNCRGGPPWPPVLPISTSCSLSQPRERGLIVEDRLIECVALLDQSCLRIGNFNNRRLTRAITCDRRSDILLRLGHAFTRQRDTRCRATNLRLCRVELLREATQRDCP